MTSNLTGKSCLDSNSVGVEDSLDAAQDFDLCIVQRHRKIPAARDANPCSPVSIPPNDSVRP